MSFYTFSVEQCRKMIVLFAGALLDNHDPRNNLDHAGLTIVARAGLKRIFEARRTLRRFAYDTSGAIVSAVLAPLGFCLQAEFTPMSANIFALVIAHNELTEESRMSSL